MKHNSVHTLKTLLETYLVQTPKPIPNLQEEATKIARDVLEKAEAEPGEEQDPASSDTTEATTANALPVPAPVSNGPSQKLERKGSSTVTIKQKD